MGGELGPLYLSSSVARTDIKHFPSTFMPGHGPSRRSNHKDQDQDKAVGKRPAPLTGSCGSPFQPGTVLAREERHPPVLYSAGSIRKKKKREGHDSS